MFKIFIIAISISFTYAKDIKLLNVSYDPTREFYRAFNSNFTKYYKEKTGNNLTILQSHGGSGSQARSVIDGLEADVVTLALAYDIDAISIFGNKLYSNWQSKFANDSSPYTSTIVFLVKKCIPKIIYYCDDLTQNGIKALTLNPKCSC